MQAGTNAGQINQRLKPVAAAVPNLIAVDSESDGTILAALDSEDYMLVQFEDDIRGIAQEQRFDNAADITGIVVKWDDFQFREVWVTDSARPFEKATGYTRVL